MGASDYSVLHVITRLDRGGSADVVLDLARHLAADGVRTGIVYGRTLDPGADLADYSSRYDVPMYPVPRLVREVSPPDDFAALVSIWRVIRRFKPDIVHTHTSKAGIVGRIAAVMAGKPGIVHTPHGHVFYGYFGPWATKAFIVAERFAARFTGRIVTLTAAGRDDHLHFRIGYPDIYRIIPSGVDTGRFEHADGSGIRKEFGCEEAKIVGWAGRLEPVKDCATFLRAMARVLAERPDVRVLVAGDGGERGDLDDLAVKLGISDRVRFMGNRDDMPAVFAAFDVFVLSSVNEGFGRVIVEAMASGVPVVSTSVGGTSEVIDDGITGLLVPAEDPVKMAAAVLRVLVEPGLAERLRAHAREGIGKYTTLSMVDSYETLYRDLAGSGNASRSAGDMCRR